MATDALRRDTYRTLDEQKGRLSPAEERFERGRRTLGLFVGPALFVLVLAAPLDLDRKQHTLAAILALVIAFGVIGAVTSPLMSNTAGAAMLLPIALGVMSALSGSWRSRPAGGGVAGAPSACASAPPSCS